MQFASIFGILPSTTDGICLEPCHWCFLERTTYMKRWIQRWFPARTQPYPQKKEEICTTCIWIMGIYGSHVKTFQEIEGLIDGFFQPPWSLKKDSLILVRPAISGGGARYPYIDSIWKIAIPLLEFQNPTMISSLGLKRTKFSEKITTGAIKKTPWFFRVYFWGWNPAQVSRDNNKPWIIYKDLRTLNNQDFMLHVMDLFEGSKTWVMQKSPSKMRAMSLSSYLQQSYLSAPRWLGRGVGGGCFFLLKNHTHKIFKNPQRWSSGLVLCLIDLMFLMLVGAYLKPGTWRKMRFSWTIKRVGDPNKMGFHSLQSCWY